MKIQNNPFNSASFEKTWMKHFKPDKSIHSFNFIKGIRFYKSNYFPVYINTGKNLTKGNYYEINKVKDYKNKVFLIYDVPSYFNVKEIAENFISLRLYKSLQYPGFLINLDKYSTIEEYMLSTFGKSSRMKLRKYYKRLEVSFQISSKMYFGNIEKKEYDFLFEHFMSLLIKRYSKKEISYNNMHPKEWGFYKDVAYPLILEKKASLFVVYDEEQPIAITYSYHSDGTILDTITVFDIDYKKFNLGYVNNLKLIEWCLKNNIKKLDFSKGYFDYKKRLGNLKYDFEYHIYYDSSSNTSRFLAFLIKTYFDTKSYLRNKKINEKFHRITYWLKNKNSRKKKDLIYEFSNVEKEYRQEEMAKIDINSGESNLLKKIVFDFLYLKNESIKDVQISKVINENAKYLIEGRTCKVSVHIKH